MKYEEQPGYVRSHIDVVILRQRLAKEAMFHDILLGLAIGVGIILLAWGFSSL